MTLTSTVRAIYLVRLMSLCRDCQFSLLACMPVSCSSDLLIKIWDVQNEWRNTKTFSGHDHTVSSVRFMPGDQQIVSASRDKTIRIFDVAST